MPTANAMPATEMTLMDLPMAAMATKAPITETGIANDTTRVALPDRKNKSSISAASAPPTKMFC